MSRYKVAFDHDNMTPAPGGKATVQKIWNTDDGVMHAYGDTVPTDGTAGYAPGCVFVHADGARGTAVYLNDGTKTSCDFNPVVTSMRPTYGTAAGRGPSPNVWTTCPMLDYMLDPTQGMVYFNDFQGGYALANGQANTYLGDGVSGFTGATAGSTIASLTTDPNGVAVLASTTDNESVGISVLGSKNIAGQFVITAGKKSWFETRIKFVNITDAKIGAFIGFAQEGLLAEDGILSDADAMADVDYLGFVRIAADGDKLDLTYNTNGGAAGVVQEDAVTVAADTWVKVGIYCDGTNIHFYADGVEVGTAVAVAATEVPDGEEMAFYFILNEASADDATASIDWVRIAREF